MKAFTNRYELKYILDLSTYFKIRKEVGFLFKPDPLAGKAKKYDVISVYYDTPSLKFFWEKIDGEEQRIKVRMRTYINSLFDKKQQKIFLEIKKRKNKNVFKKRINIPETLMNAALKPPFLDKLFTEQLDESSEEAIKEIQYITSRLRLKPTLVISYTREPFVSKDNLNVRITFDSNVKYRGNNFSLTRQPLDKHVLSPHHVIMEIKYTDYFPLWLVFMIQKHCCDMRTFSKYCIGMEQYIKEYKSPETGE